MQNLYKQYNTLWSPTIWWNGNKKNQNSELGLLQFVDVVAQLQGWPELQS